MEKLHSRGKNCYLPVHMASFETKRGLGRMNLVPSVAGANTVAIILIAGKRT
mgnify:CR=1 FL=1